MEKFGLLNAERPLGFIDLPASGVQIHLHGLDRNTITHGSIVQHGTNEVLGNLNGYEASMVQHHAHMMGFDPFVMFDPTGRW